MLVLEKVVVPLVVEGFKAACHRMEKARAATSV